MMTNDAAISPADGIDFLLQPWRQCALKLVPLIGESGFCALYARAARLGSAHFDWLLPVHTGKSIDALLASLRVLFAAVGQAEASRANDAMLTTFTKLLVGLIGEALTMQLLAVAPAGRSAMSVQEQL